MNIDITTQKEISLSSDGKIHSDIIPLNSSKSESNRALVIKALADNNIQLNNLAKARDTQTMIRLLNDSEGPVWDVLDAGTTMRFLTAFLAINSNSKVITGTERMQQRPIGPLVDALIKIGAHITYENKSGYPPLKINKLIEQKADTIEIPGNISSQYISALLMIAPTLPHGLKIVLTGDIFSKPYIEMTLDLMKRFGVNHEWIGVSSISILPQKYQSGTYTIESDWSGASYWYSLVALANEGSIKLLGLRDDSYQGDRVIANIMDSLGVSSKFETDGVTLTKKATAKNLEIDFRDCPDLAQTVLVVATIKNVPLKMTGLESLRIKETDRIAAMKAELAKIGGQLEEYDGVWTLNSLKLDWPIKTEFETYEDHRMAMAFAPLAMIKPVIIAEPVVVNKSYPDFWEHLLQIGMKIS
jgi:3-phosphoshikimate 1-carboxyvinyltransferase